MAANGLVCFRILDRLDAYNLSVDPTSFRFVAYDTQVRCPFITEAGPIPLGDTTFMPMNPVIQD